MSKVTKDPVPPIVCMSVRDPDEPVGKRNLDCEVLGIGWGQVSNSEYLRGKLLVRVTLSEIGLGIRRLGLQPWAVLLVFAGVIG